MSHPAYDIEPRNTFFEANRVLGESEIRPGQTVSFAAEVDLTEVEADAPAAAPYLSTVIVPARRTTRGGKL